MQHEGVSPVPPFTDREGRLCGFLNIEHTERSGTFCRRYFVLDQSSGKLDYFMDSPANLPEAWKSPVGEIFIHNISKVNDVSQQRPKISHCFTITVTGHTYCLQAESAQGKLLWTQAITNASKIRVPTKTQSALVEWHQGDITQAGSYIAEIAGGVVCKMPIQSVEVEGPGISADEDSCHSSTSSSTPPASLNSAATSRKSRHLSSGNTEPSNSVDTLRQPTAILAGYCVKQGGVRKNWKRRYFVLHENGLSYFKSELDKQPIRCIALEDILHVGESTDGPIRDNLFEVITAKRTFYVQCDTPSEMQAWMCGLEEILHRHKVLPQLHQEPQYKPDTQLLHTKYTPDLLHAKYTPDTQLLPVYAHQSYRVAQTVGQHQQPQHSGDMRGAHPQHTGVPHHPRNSHLQMRESRDGELLSEASTDTQHKVWL